MTPEFTTRNSFRRLLREAAGEYTTFVVFALLLAVSVMGISSGEHGHEAQSFWEEITYRPFLFETPLVIAAIIRLELSRRSKADRQQHTKRK